MTAQYRTAGGPAVQLYTTDDGQTRLEVGVDDATVWLTYEQMAELFGRDQSVVAKHARAALRDGGVFEESFGQNLPKTPGLSRLCRWATGVPRQHLTPGPSVNPRRLDLLHQALRTRRDVGTPPEGTQPRGAGGPPIQFCPA
jgi:hypothetical protein